MEFKAWPKTPRLENELMVITEKIDGTNACVIFHEVSKGEEHNAITTLSYEGDLEIGVWAQSRTRLIYPEDDNFGFAKYVKENAEELFFLLGMGRHYGEWWGQGIQRTYGADRKYFSLFNTFIPVNLNEIGVKSIPVIYSGKFDLNIVPGAIESLKVDGSRAYPGYMKPEGICIYLRSTDTIYRVPFDK